MAGPTLVMLRSAEKVTGVVTADWLLAALGSGVGVPPVEATLAVLVMLAPALACTR